MTLLQREGYVPHFPVRESLAATSPAQNKRLPWPCCWGLALTRKRIRGNVMPFYRSISLMPQENNPPAGGSQTRPSCFSSASFFNKTLSTAGIIDQLVNHGHQTLQRHMGPMAQLSEHAPQDVDTRTHERYSFDGACGALRSMPPNLAMGLSLRNGHAARDPHLSHKGQSREGHRLRPALYARRGGR